MTAKNGRHPLRLIRILAVAICLTLAAGLAGALTVPAHAATVGIATGQPSDTHDPGMPGPGGSKNVPTLGVAPSPAANPNAPLPVPTAWAVQYSGETGIDPRTLLAIYLDEGYGPPHGTIADGVRHIVDGMQKKPEGPSLGITSVKQSTFNEVKALHGDIFKNDSWLDLSWNPALAMRVLAWKLSDLEVGRDPAQLLPDHWNPSYKREQVFALAWNGGIGRAMDYVSGRSVPDKGKLDTYLDHFNQSWPKADQMIDCRNLYLCTY